MVVESQTDSSSWFENALDISDFDCSTTKIG